MEKTEFKNLLKKINDGIKKNTKIIDKYLNEEFSKGNNLNIKKLSKIISNYEKIEVEKTENKSLAVCYSGLPEITITYILDSILYNNKITLCVNGFKNINTLIVGGKDRGVDLILTRVTVGLAVAFFVIAILINMG